MIEIDLNDEALVPAVRRQHWPVYIELILRKSGAWTGLGRNAANSPAA